MSDKHDNRLHRAIGAAPDADQHNAPMIVASIVRTVGEWLRDMPPDRLGAAANFVVEAMELERATRENARRVRAETESAIRNFDAVMNALAADAGVSPSFKMACGCKARGAAAESEVEFKPEPHFLDGDGPSWDAGIK